jgi:hypothetical protein
MEISNTCKEELEGELVNNEPNLCAHHLDQEVQPEIAVNSALADSTLLLCFDQTRDVQETFGERFLSNHSPASLT